MSYSVAGSIAGGAGSDINGDVVPQHQIDISSALELQLTNEQGQKFTALRNLQAKKFKSMFASIDAKDKEIAKLKLLSQDNRRTQMIQALKNKIRDMELVIDVTKAIVLKKPENVVNMESLNELIMKKTISGPKRFRPLTREELENKIFELEKALTKATNNNSSSSNNHISGNHRSSRENASVNGSNNMDYLDEATGDADAKSTKRSPRPISTTATRGAGTGGTGGTDGRSVSSSIRDQTDGKNKLSADMTTLASQVVNFAQLVEEVEALKRALEAKNNVVAAQREEIARLRVRNAELCVVDDKDDISNREYCELKDAYDDLNERHDEFIAKFAACAEENMQIRADAVAAVEDKQTEVSALNAHVELVLKQNAELVDLVAALEAEVDKYAGAPGSAQVVKSSYQATQRADKGSAASSAAVSRLEQQLAKEKTSLRAAETKNQRLTQDLLQVDLLKDNLRERNVLVKDLKRELEEWKTRFSALKKASDVSTATGGTGSGPGASISQQERDKLLELLAENTRLKQALQAATVDSSLMMHHADAKGASPSSSNPNRGSQSKLSAQQSTPIPNEEMEDIRMFLNSMLDQCNAAVKDILRLHDLFEDSSVVAENVSDLIPMAIELRTIKERLFRDAVFAGPGSGSSSSGGGGGGSLGSLDSSVSGLLLRHLFPKKKLDELVRLSEKIEGIADIAIAKYTR